MIKIENGSLQITGNIHFCPRCGQTCIQEGFEDYDTRSCQFCNSMYTRNIWEHHWQFCDGRKVDADVSPVIMSLQNIATYTYGVPIYYLPDMLFQQIAKIKRETHDPYRCSFAVNDRTGESFILMHANMPPKKRAIMLAHELGHARDYYENYQDFASWHTPRCTKQQLEKEQTAWLYATDLLAQSGFDDWDTFVHQAQSSIGTYYTYITGSAVDSYTFGLKLSMKVATIMLKQLKPKEPTLTIHAFDYLTNLHEMGELSIWDIESVIGEAQYTSTIEDGFGKKILYLWANPDQRIMISYLVGYLDDDITFVLGKTDAEYDSRLLNIVNSFERSLFCFETETEQGGDLPSLLTNCIV